MSDQPAVTATDAAAGVVVDAVASAHDSIVSRLVGLVLGALDGLGGDGWYDDKAVDAVAADLAGLTRAAQGTAADLTAAGLYQALLAGGVDARPPAPVGLPQDLRGVPQTLVWTRPVKTYRRLVAEGKPADVARAGADRRATTIAADDVSLADRTATVTYLSKVRGIAGYRRVLHPELSRTGVCGLCVAASTRTYRVDRLMPVHSNCRCGVLPVTRAWDPGLALNDAAMGAYLSVGSTGSAALKRSRFRLGEHGELGPTLVPAGGAFLTESGLRPVRDTA